MSTATNENKLRHHAEQQFAEELEELKKSDARQRPANWELSPWAVCTYLLGGELDNGFTVSAKYIGNRRIIETAVATLATDRALLLYGVPGTAKSWVSEHLAAAISGDSTRIIQGTAGTSEEQMRYGWNYAELLSKGPSRAALVESPLMRAMSEGRIARVEELTRIPADVQDTLITILSEKTLPIPELNDEVQAVRGFNLIATANNRDKGVNELSSALKRRFNTVIPPRRKRKSASCPSASPKWAARWSFPPSPRRCMKCAAWCRSSASCGTGRPKTARPSSSRPPAR